MKMPNATDDFFNRRLGDYDSGAPMHLWDAIEQKRSDRHVFWLRLKRNGLLAAFSLLSIVALSGYYWLNHTNNSPSTIAAFPILQESNDLNNSYLIKSSTANKLITSETQTSSSLGEEIQFNNTKQEKEQNVNSERLFVNESKTTAQIKEQPQSFAKESPSTIFSPTEDFTEKPATEISELSEKVVAPTLANTAQLREQQTASNINLLTLSPFDLMQDELPDPCYAFNKKEKKVKKKKKRTGPPQLYVAAYFSPDYAHKTLTLRNSEALNYLSEREKTEKFRFAFSSGFKVSLITRSGLAFRTGLNYAQINEKLDYVSGTIVDTDIVERFDLEGNLIGYDTTVVTGNIVKTTYNRFHLIDIPAIIGYELNYRRFIFSLNAGVYFNLMLKKRGEILNTNLEPQSINSNNPNALDAFRDKVGLSYFSSFGIHYKLSQNFHLTAEPHLRYYPSSFTRGNYPINQSYWSAGIMLGARIKL